MVGALCLGGSLGWIGRLLGLDPFAKFHVTVLALIGCCHIALALREFGVYRLRLPESRWQVPRRWRSVQARLVAPSYGFLLGSGVLTRLGSGVFYVVVGWVLLMGSPALGAMSLAAFGIGRVLPLLALQVVAEDFQHAVRWERVLHQWRVAIEVVNGLAMSGSGGYLVGVAILRAWR